MKNAILLVFFLIPLVVKSQIEGTWLVVDSRQVTTDFISPLDGTIFDFSDSTLKMRSVFSDTTIVFDYRVVDESLFINDSVFASIKYLSSDSIKLEIYEWMLILLYPLRVESYNELLDQDELVNHSWVFESQDRNERINFLEEAWELFVNDFSKICITRSLDFWKRGRKEMWSLLEFNGAQLLMISFDQFDPVVYVIESFDGTTIKMSGINFFFNGMKVNLNKQPNKTETELENIKNLLVRKKWQSKELIDIQRPGLKEDAYRKKMEPSGSFVVDTTLITVNELNKHKISFKFRGDETYTMYTSNRQISTGKWRLKSDGVTLVINDGCLPENYYNIISVSKDELIISSTDKFALKKRDGDYVQYNYTMKLK